MGLNTKEMWADCEKIVRNSAQHTEHWEAAVEEMREKYEALLLRGDDGTMQPIEADLVSLIHLYDKERR